MNPETSYIVLFSESPMPTSFSHDLRPRITGPGSSGSLIQPTGFASVLPEKKILRRVHRHHLTFLFRCVHVSFLSQTRTPANMLSYGLPHLGISFRTGMVRRRRGGRSATLPRLSSGGLPAGVHLPDRLCERQQPPPVPFRERGPPGVVKRCVAGGTTGGWCRNPK